MTMKTTYDEIQAELSVAMCLSQALHDALNYCSQSHSNTDYLEKLCYILIQQQRKIYNIIDEYSISLYKND